MFELFLKVHQYEHEKLLSKCRHLESELEKQKKYYERNFIPQEEIDEFKRALETKVIPFFKNFFNICTGCSKILSFRETMPIKLFECYTGD